MNLDIETIEIAKTVALLHDIGRFEQYRKFQTFNDAKSENHAEIALRIITNQTWLKDYTSSEIELINKAILCHNIRALSGDLLPHEKFMAQLIRDADKVDILHVVLQNDIGHIMGLTNTETVYQIPEEIIEFFNIGKPVAIEHANTLNDFRLVRASWIFDLNFQPSFKIFKEREYIPRIFEKIPDSEKLHELENICMEYIHKKID